MVSGSRQGHRPPVPEMIFRWSEPSAIRSATNCPAWSAAVNVGNGAYIIDGCPPGAVAPTPEERTSATPGREPACSFALATRPGLLNMSRTVVTPKVSDCARAPGTRCTCASIRPGSTVPPPASITSSPSWAAEAAEHVVIRPSANRTEVQACDFVPSNPFAFPIVVAALKASSGLTLPDAALAGPRSCGGVGALECSCGPGCEPAEAG